MQVRSTMIAMLLAVFAVTFSTNVYSQEHQYEFNEPATFDIDLGSYSVDIAPSSGQLTFIGTSLVYTPNNAASMASDGFSVTVEELGGSVISVTGLVMNGSVVVEYSTTFTSPNASGVLTGYSTGTELISPNGLVVNNAIVNFSSINHSYMNSVGMMRGLQDIWHGLTNTLWPGSICNHSGRAVLIWSDKTGYYWLLPGGCTPTDNDEADYVKYRGTWYKIPGFWGPTELPADNSPPIDSSSGTPLGQDPDWNPGLPKGGIPLPTTIPVVGVPGKNYPDYPSGTQPMAPFIEVPKGFNLNK